MELEVSISISVDLIFTVRTFNIVSNPNPNVRANGRLFGCNPRLRASLLDDRTVEIVFWRRDEWRCRLVARVT